MVKQKHVRLLQFEPIPITKITLSETEVTLKKKEQVSLEAEIEPENTTDSKALTWTSEDDSIAYVDDKGKVTANAVGTTKITAKAGNVFAECTITVRDVTTEEMLVDETLTSLYIRMLKYLLYILKREVRQQISLQMESLQIIYHMKQTGIKQEHMNMFLLIQERIIQQKH